MLFYSDAAGWSSFGLILVALIGFISYHFWKKKQGDSKSEKYKPTDEGYENLKFQKQMIEEKNEQLEKEIKETKEKLEKLHEELKSKQELEVKFSALEASYNSLRTNHESLSLEMERLKQERESLSTENMRLSNKETELSQKVSERESQLEDRKVNLRNRVEKIENLEGVVSNLQERLKRLEVEKQELLTKQDNWAQLNLRVDEELKNLKHDYKNIQEIQINLLRENTELTEQKKHLEEETQSVKQRYESYWDFYEKLRNSGLEPNLEELLRYKQFHTEYFELIQIQRKREEEKRDSTLTGKEYELSWKPDLEKLFSTEELEFIDITSQPSVEGKRGDYKVSFRDSKNASTTENQLNIYVELKHTSKEENTLGKVNAIKDERMNEDLKIARENASKGGDYDFVFLITNREIGQDRFREKGFFWISTDKDYKFFGLKPPVKSVKDIQQVKPAIIIMTREKSFEFIWNFYTLWKNWSSLNVVRETDLLLKNINEAFASPEFKKDLVKWINDSDEFNLEVSEKMEKQWVELVNRIRIISEFWAKKKKQAYKLNTRAVKLRRSTDWVVTGEGEELKEISHSGGSEVIDKELKNGKTMEVSIPLVLGDNSFKDGISKERETLK